MVGSGSVHCSLLVLFVVVAVLTVCTNGESESTKCSQIANTIEYETDQCIYVKQWFRSSMREADAACRNLKTSADLEWYLPKFDSESTAKWEALSDGVKKLDSMETATFWIGLVRKKKTWTWLMDGSVLDETKAMWKKRSEHSQSGDCTLAEWVREKQSRKWIESACQNGSMGVSILVCETKSEQQKSKSTPNWKTKAASSDDPTKGKPRPAVAAAPGNSSEEEGTWDAYGKWIVLGVCLALVATLVVLGTFFYVRRRRRMSRRQCMARRDPTSSSNADSPTGGSYDSISDYFQVSKSDSASPVKHGETKKSDAPKKKVVRSEPIGPGKKSSSDSSSPTEVTTPSSYTAMTYS